MKKIISIFALTAMLLSIFCVTAFAENETDYKKIYMDYAKSADEKVYNSLNNAVSGMMMVDLKGNGVPQIILYSTTTVHYDENGKQITINDENYDNPAFTHETYDIEKFITIKDGKVVEYDSPHNADMPYRLGEGSKDRLELCMVVTDNEGKRYLATYDGSINSYYVAYYMTENGVEYESAPIEHPEKDFPGFYNKYIEMYDVPSSYVDFYDKTTKTKITKTQAMEMLLKNYINPEETAKVSSWAKDEVEKAINYGLVPEQMLEDDLTKYITRAEFAGISYKLLETLEEKELNFHGGYIVDIEGNPYEYYIRGSYALGITNGTGRRAYNEGVEFSPDFEITREQLATMLLRVVKKHEFEDWSLTRDEEYPLDISGAIKFNDDSSISPYANEAVYYMSKNDIIKGIDSTHFAPNDFATKEQAILLALRIYNFKK